MQDNDCLFIGVESRDIAERTVCDVEDGSKITCAVEVDVRHGGRVRSGTRAKRVVLQILKPQAKKYGTAANLVGQHKECP